MRNPKIVLLIQKLINRMSLAISVRTDIDLIVEHIMRQIFLKLDKVRMIEDIICYMQKALCPKIDKKISGAKKI
jgi:hypothetical protein